MLNDVYNFKIISYPDYDEVVLYDEPIRCNDLNSVDSDGVVIKNERNYKLTFNPFDNEFQRLKDISDKTIIQNRNRSYKRTIDNLHKLVYNCKDWELFVTFTFSPDRVDRYDYMACSKLLSKWLNNIKTKYCNDLKYICVPERHKDGAWHFHALFACVGDLPLVYSGKRDSSRRKIYNLPKYRFGWSTATYLGDVSKASSYLLKYLKKDMFDSSSVMFCKKKYWSSRNLVLPNVETRICRVPRECMLYHLKEHINSKYHSSNAFVDAYYIRLDGRFNDLVNYPSACFEKN